MKWLTNEYERLYKQVKEEGKRVVCYLNYRYSGDKEIQRDVCTCHLINGSTITFQVRGTSYIWIWEDDAQSKFESFCQQYDVQWLDESEDHLREAALRICNALQQKHRSTFKYLDVANEDKIAVLHHFGISAGSSEINTP